MTPANMIKDLDKALRDGGQIVTLKRRIGTGNTFATLTVWARIKDYTANEIVGIVQATDNQFVMSPSEINAATTWAAAAGGIQWPLINDFITVDGKDRKIMQAHPRKAGNTVVRIDGRIAG